MKKQKKKNKKKKKTVVTDGVMTMHASNQVLYVTCGHIIVYDLTL